MHIRSRLSPTAFTQPTTADNRADARDAVFGAISREHPNLKNPTVEFTTGLDRDNLINYFGHVYFRVRGEENGAPKVLEGAHHVGVTRPGEQPFIAWDSAQPSANDDRADAASKTIFSELAKVAPNAKNVSLEFTTGLDDAQLGEHFQFVYFRLDGTADGKPLNITGGLSYHSVGSADPMILWDGVEPPPAPTADGFDAAAPTTGDAAAPSSVASSGEAGGALGVRSEAKPARNVRTRTLI